MRPERHNAVKVLLFFDIGGSMDWHIKATEELFSAARTEFKHLEYFYFHNCLYERVWKENRRRLQETTPTWDVLHTYPHDYKVIFVGDASMWPYEIVAPGGSVEHFNDEPGALWLERVARTYPACVWLNPVPEKEWNFTPVDQHGSPAHGRANVPADAGRARPRDARVGAVTHEPDGLRGHAATAGWRGHLYLPRPAGVLPVTPNSSDLVPKAAASNPSAASPRLSSSRIAAARLGMRFLKRKSSNTISSSPDSMI